MARTSKVVDNFEAAVRAHEMIGAAHPEDQDEIEREFKRAKATLLRVVLRRSAKK